MEVTLEEEIEHLKKVAHVRYRWAWELQKENLELKQKLASLASDNLRRDENV